MRNHARANDMVKFSGLLFIWEVILIFYCLLFVILVLMSEL